MREIKFRAWDKRHKEMNWLDQLDIVGRVEGFGLRAMKPMGSGNIDDYELMQYTGLKDKNGKEIYEGDIMNDGGVVTFLGGRYIIDYGNGDNWEDLIGDEDEIIGNIYENKDLLTNK